MWKYENACTQAELDKLNDLHRRMEALRHERKRLGTVRAMIRQRAVARLRKAQKTGQPIRVLVEIGDGPEW